MKRAMKRNWRLFLTTLLMVFLFLMIGCSQDLEAPLPQDEATLASTSTAVAGEVEETLEDEETNASSGQIDLVGKIDKKEDLRPQENLTCEITISCETLVKNPAALASGKRELIPTNGVILPLTKVKLNKGESVFDILARATRDNGIHMEFVKTPVYNSAYIEGIHNIYEFDGGEASGWMYSVNGTFPQRGASTYILEPNDRINWVYSCDLGRDVGGYSINQKEE